MSDKRSEKKSNKENRKKKLKCATCEFYDYEMDSCIERDIENCSRQNNINFSKCGSYLVKNKMIYF